jgi:hypothetical protein
MHASTRRARLLALPLLLLAALWAQAAPPAPQRAAARTRGGYELTRADVDFLEDLSRRAFQYFVDHADPGTGLLRDRARTGGSPIDSETGRDVASIAATGFGLTALCVAAERRWVAPGEARERVRATLRFFADRAYHNHGWFYHWMDLRTGERAWRSEVSSIDTALLLGGVLTARQCFRGDLEVVRLATRIYERVDFRWMLNDHPTLLSHGWYPERGFIPHRWRDYSEQMMLILLAVGSPTHPVTPAAWRAWERKWITYGGYHYLNSHPPLFIHQYSHAWVDFRGRREGWYPFVNYFENSVQATRAHRQFCIDLAKEFPAYGPDVWGISASDSERGYVAWGGPPRDPAIDGTVVPYAAAGSLMFTPDISLAALRTLKERYGEKTYGRYGFADAFNPNTGWVDTDVIGIDQGITLIGAENLRDGLVWRHFMKNREITRALDLVGLRETTAKARGRAAR